jgi:hypothetical protein
MLLCAFVFEDGVIYEHWVAYDVYPGLVTCRHLPNCLSFACLLLNLRGNVTAFGSTIGMCTHEHPGDSAHSKATSGRTMGPCGSNRGFEFVRALTFIVIQSKPVVGRAWGLGSVGHHGKL